ncbi:hypothetical protein [Azospirillum thermophilum]|uniref:hypothetical protein n=1 Tax=Azospirillum thermophilum TaxID=2202148 RepID=UPI001FE7ABA1|nr:hypothetical protein [Azospirillum thermophilum]
MLGDRATLKAVAAMAPDGAMRLDRLEVDGRNGRLTASAALAGGRVDARSRLEIAKLDPVGEAVGTPMAGSLALDATARGPLDTTARGPLDGLEAEATLTGRDLAVADRRFGATEVTVTAAKLPAAPTGRLRARTQMAGAGLSLDGAYALDGRNTLRLSDLAVASGGNRVTGAVTVALDTLLATGRLEGALPDLKGLSELAGLPLDGAAGFTVSLDGRGGRQAASLSADATNLRVEGEGGPLLTARRLTASADVADALGTPSGKARLELADGSAAGNALAGVTASLDGSLARAGFQAAATGAGQSPLALDLAGTLSGDASLTRIRIERFQGRYQDETFRATGPATITLGDRRYEVAGLQIVSGGARLAADLGLTGERLRGEIRLDQVPMALARLASPALRLDGTLNAQATLGGTVRNPQADATLRVAGLHAQEASRAGVPGVNATVRAQWRDRRLSVDGDAATTTNSGRISLTAAVPLVMDPASYAVSVPPRGRWRLRSTAPSTRPSPTTCSPRRATGRAARSGSTSGPAARSRRRGWAARWR